MKADLSLYVLVDPAQARGRPLAEIAAAAAQGGATLIQLRDKTGTTREMIETARAIVTALEGSGVPLLVNDRVDVALAAEADGVRCSGAARSSAQRCEARRTWRRSSPR
jgi:thiamine-phosphate pyrophosphorylase